MNPIFHITSRREADEAARLGNYTPKAFEVDGFIHCSYAHQLTRVADHIFRGQSDLVILEVDRSALSVDVIDENLQDGVELFPHIYGAIPISAIVRTHEFPCRMDGGFDLPWDMID